MKIPLQKYEIGNIAQHFFLIYRPMLLSNSTNATIQS